MPYSLFLVTYIDQFLLCWLRPIHVKARNIHLYISVNTRDVINNRLTIENPNRGVINSAVIRQTPHWYLIGGRVVPGGRAVVLGNGTQIEK